MKEDLTFSQKLKEAGADDGLIEQYLRYTDSGNRRGQERVLCRCRGIKK